MPDVIVLPDMVIPAHKTIQTLLLDVPSEQPYICVKPAYYRMLIEQKNGKMLHFSKMLCPWGNFDRDFKGLLKRGGVKRKSFHDLRRTFAGKLLDNGYGLKEVQTLMRHSSIQTTARFYQNVEERALINKVNGTFKHYVSNVL
jgi:integrase